MTVPVEEIIRRQLEVMGIQPAPVPLDTTQDAAGDAQAAQEAPQASVSVESALSQAIGGPLALNNDLALGRIAGGARTIVNGKQL